MNQIKKHKGVIIAAIIIVCWLSTTLTFFHLTLNWFSPFTYLFFLIQTHLYTGLFITAHDAMHGVVSANKVVNKTIGRLCAGLFAFNHYDKLLVKHHEHHRFVATDQDPDYYEGSFWPWYFSFAKQYVTIWQIVLIAITFNILIQFFPEPNVLVYWALPSIAATFQLFYFGTYLPHRGEHEVGNVHKSSSQKRNHLWAFISCYFFGYHYEHHAYPYLPWWKLYQAKDSTKQP
ncbi:MAG: fatty acid desaturase [Flammeovirgaceae bacterium]